MTEFSKAMTKKSLVDSFESKLSWTVETFDFIKDGIYMIVIRHGIGAFLILAFSLVMPFAAHDGYQNYENKTYLLHNLLTYFGLVYTD